MRICVPAFCFAVGTCSTCHVWTPAPCGRCSVIARSHVRSCALMQSMYHGMSDGLAEPRPHNTQWHAVTACIQMGALQLTARGMWLLPVLALQHMLSCVMVLIGTQLMRATLPAWQHLADRKCRRWVARPAESMHRAASLLNAHAGCVLRWVRPTTIMPASLCSLSVPSSRQQNTTTPSTCCLKSTKSAHMNYGPACNCSCTPSFPACI